MDFLIYNFTLALLSVLASSLKYEPNCEELIKPLVLDGNYSSIMGKWILAEGVSEGIMAMIQQTMDTHWMELSPGTNNNTILLRQAYRMDDTCRSEVNDLPLGNSTLYEPGNNGTVQYYLLSSFPNYLTGYFANNERNYPTRLLLLFSRERGASNSARDLYKKQAECLGFPLIFTLYNEVSELCQMETEETKAEQN